MAEDFKTPFNKAVEKIKDIAVEATKLAYAEQGHVLTGALQESIEGKVRQTDAGAIIDLMLLDYGIPVNTGVPAANVRYNPNIRTGKKFSRYIAGLILFAELKFRVPEKEAKNIAFAIARKHAKEGIPTKASKKYSKTGKRTGALQEALKAIEDPIQQIINEVVIEYTQSLIIKVFTDNLKDVKITR